MKRKLASLLLAVAMCAFAVQAPAAETKSGELSVDSLTFTYVTSPLNVPSIVEKNRAVFAGAFPGVKIDYAEITSGANQTQALASGDVQILYAVGGASVILSAANGADIKVLNMYSRAPKAFCLFARDKSLSSPESLRGKTIAGPAGTNLHELLVAYLNTAGMTIKDVNYVNMSIPDAKAALDGGSADVAMLGGAAAYNAGKAGRHKITDGEGLIQAIICVAVTKRFHDEHPDVIARLAEAQAKITAYMKDEEDAAIAAAAKALDLDEGGVRDMFAFYDFSTAISRSDREGFQKTADFMFSSGMIEKAFDTSALFFE